LTKKILVIREFDNFSRILGANGFEIINLPLIETKAIDDLSEFKKILETIENYDGVFLTSKQAAEIFRAKLKTDYRGKVYVLGKRSYDILKDEKFNLHFDEAVNTAHEMLENIALKELKDKKFLFVRGEKSLRIVPDFLSKLAIVDETIVYETRNITVEIDKKNELREKNKFTAVCFFSPSAAQSFIEQFGAEILHQTEIATIGKTTAEFLERRNLKVDFVSSKSNAENFAAELIEYLTNGKRKMENGK
jgi:uroporphyrinogen-III synthase